MQEKIVLTYGTAVLTLGNSVLFHEGPATILGQRTEGHPFVDTQGNLLEGAQRTAAKSLHESKLRGAVRRMHAAKVVVKPKLLAKQGITWGIGSECSHLLSLEYQGPYNSRVEEENPEGEVVDEVVAVVSEEEEEEVARLDTSEDEAEPAVVPLVTVSDMRQSVLDKRARHNNRIARGGRLAAKRSKK
ncbi:hypothetical protein CYMTET_34061 [Cymbomonas tetramitiformis]|uniref:Uncharacterized protein n=1 Tax=Cymbomonas tetramitiformis TaxID=36881 RepID=A0AAE0FBW9_9CHLO|nr:hypothetical protein CYMTET_34061 [Cymbomonas tetramitiformis]